jgi:MraZ protein
MVPPVFLNEYSVRLDDQSRLVLPAEVVRALPPEESGSGWFAVVGANETCWLYPENTFEALLAELRDVQATDERIDAWKRRTAEATRLEMDRERRVVLPKALVAQTRLNGELQLIGARDHLELWNQAEWAVHFDALMERLRRKRG